MAEFEAEALARTAALSLADREATRDFVQAYIDAYTDENGVPDTTLTADTGNASRLAAVGFTASADSKDSEWVVLNFPQDPVGQPKFYLGGAGRIVADLGGQWHGEVPMERAVIRANQRKALQHLAAISFLLP